MDSGDRVKTLVVEITPKPAARPRFCRGGPTQKEVQSLAEGVYGPA